MTVSTFEIIGHRGAAHDAPENTLASFKLAFAQRADAVELDVHLTRDGRVVVIHDDDTKRTGGVKRKVAAQTFADLRRLNVGNWGRWKGKGFDEKIPSLDEVLAVAPDHSRLFIEIKCGAEILPELEKVLGRWDGKSGLIVLIGFDYEVMKCAKNRLQDIEVCWLAGSRGKTRRYPDSGHLIREAKAAGFDGLDLHSGFRIDKAFVDKIHDNGLKLYTWTVDDRGVGGRAIASGVDGITTNRPGWLRERLMGR